MRRPSVGEREPEPAALSDRALRPDLSAMGFNDASGDVEAQAHASPIVLNHLPKPLENTFQHVAGYAGASVLIIPTDRGGGPLDLVLDLAAFGGEFDRIGDEV